MFLGSVPFLVMDTVSPKVTLHIELEQNVGYNIRYG